MGLEPFFVRLLVDRIRALEAKLADLTRRVAAIEARPAIQYAGVWRTGQRYTRGAACTHDGALWICEHDSVDERPGNGATAWRLAVKRHLDLAGDCRAAGFQCGLCLLGVMSRRTRCEYIESALAPKSGHPSG